MNRFALAGLALMSSASLASNA